MNFRASEEERARIHAAADRAGLTVGSYVRSRVLETPTTRAVRRPPLATAQLAQLLGLLGVAGGDLQKIAKGLTQANTVSESELTASLQAFREAAAVIMQTLGKRPHDH